MFSLAQTTFAPVTISYVIELIAWRLIPGTILVAVVTWVVVLVVRKQRHK